MSQAQKINALIDKILTEELASIKKEGTQRTFITPSGTSKDLTSDQKKDIANLPTGASYTTARKGAIQQITQQRESMNEETPIPSATEIAGKIAEMMDSLKAVSEGTQDVKMKKIADKAAMQLEAAKATLEALTAHEVMLQEKEHEMFVKQAGKKRKTIERYLNKKVKMPEVVEKLMKKMPEEKIADMLKKSNGELDEEKVAGAMMKVALKEGYIVL